MGLRPQLPVREAGSSTGGATGGKALAIPGENDLAWLNSFRGVDEKISPDRMKEAVAAALGDGDPARAMSAFAQLLRELTPENAAAALEAVNTGAASGNAARYLNLLAHAWDAVDGRGAMAGVDTVRGRDRGMAKAIALSAWAGTDPDGVLCFGDRCCAGGWGVPSDGFRGFSGREFFRPGPVF